MGWVGAKSRCASTKGVLRVKASIDPVSSSKRPVTGLAPAAAVTLTSHFDRLWLKAPIGLISLADAEACAELLGQEARVLASFYAMRANWRLDLSILGRVLGFRVFKRISTDNRL